MELIQQGKERDSEMNAAAAERARELDTTVMGRYSIWRKEYENPNSDSTLKLMRDQIIMAKAYAKIAKAKNYDSLYDSLLEHSRKSQYAIGEANSDAELQPRYFHKVSSISLMHVLCSFINFLFHIQCT